MEGLGANCKYNAVECWTVNRGDIHTSFACVFFRRDTKSWWSLLSGAMPGEVKDITQAVNV